MKLTMLDEAKVAYVNAQRAVTNRGQVESVVAEKVQLAQVAATLAVAEELALARQPHQPATRWDPPA